MSDTDENDAPSDLEGAEGQTNPEAEASVPEGMRVVRKRRKRKSDASRQTLYLKKQEILLEMETEEDGLGVSAQMERLKQVAREKEPPMEDKWGESKHRRRGSRWLLIGLGVIVLPLVIFAVVISVTKSPSGVTTGGTGSLLNLDEPEEAISAFDRTSPEAWFNENSVKAFELAIGLLEECNEAAHPNQLNAVVRDAERVLRKLTITDVEQASDFSLGDPRTLSWEYGAAGETGYMVIMGRRANHIPFRAYFVKTDEGLRLDWMATHGMSDIAVPSLVKEATNRSTLVRSWVGKQPWYDVEKGHASTRSWYIILEPTKEEFVWAYAPAKSELDEKLRDILSYGRMVEERPDEVRATIRLAKPSVGFRENEFEITELTTVDWVAP
jgi:hypothetical protein